MALAPLLRSLPPARWQAYLTLPGDLQNEISKYIEETGIIPPLRRLPILFGPECSVPPERYAWMA